MSKKIKNEQKKFLGETLNQYDKNLNEGIAQLDKKNREQNHKISSLVNSFDNEYLEKDVEGNMTTLENSKDGMVIINEIQGSTEVNYCKDGEKELILNGDIDTQGESFVTITEGVDGGLVDVSLEGNTEINLSKTKDPVLVTREFDDINCNIGKLQYTIDDVTTINDEPGKVDIDRIVGDTMVNHAVNGSEELVLNAHINESGDNSITLNGVTSDGGKVDVALEGNTLVNVSKTKNITALPLDEELTYLYANTQYTLQFVSDKEITVDITLGGTKLLAQSIVQGLNRISITTPATLVDNRLIIDGVGANISEVVVTNTDREFRYFEGMKSVGECEGNGIEILSHNGNLYKCLENSYYKIYGSGVIVVEDNEDSFIFEVNDWDKGISYLISTEGLFKNKKYKLTWEKYNELAIPQLHASGITLLNSNKRVKEQVSFEKISNVDWNFELPDSFEQGDILEIRFKTSIASGQNGACNICINEVGVAKNTTLSKLNKQQLTHEPLRAVEDVKDRYVMIDGKWYIERNCRQENMSELKFAGDTRDTMKCLILFKSKPKAISNIFSNSRGYESATKGQMYVQERGDGMTYLWIPTDPMSRDEFTSFLNEKNATIVYAKAEPTYEQINYNPFEVYTDVTHITANSTIPTNITVKNHGYNLVALKENTQYTLYVNKDTTNALTYRLGDYVEINSPSKFTFTTPSTLTDKTLRIDSKGAKVKDLMLIEGTPANDPVGYFDGLKSSYECERVTDESDENYGKYKVDIKVVGKNLFNAKAITNYSYQINNGITPSCSSNGEVILNGIAENIYNFRVLSGNNIGGNISNNRPLYKYIHSLPNGTSLTLSNDLGFESYWALFRNGKTTYHKDTINIQTGDIVNCFIRIPLGTTLNNQVIHIQIEEGDTATEYEPYFESTQTIYLNSPLLKGDEIVWKDNKIQHYHKMGIGMLDGSVDEDWRFFNGDFIEKVNTLDFYIPNYHGINKSIVISDKFKTNNGGTYLKDEEAISGTGGSGTNIWLSINKSRINPQNTNGLKEWLSNNPIKFVYTLETPYYEEISNYPLKLNVIANSSLSTESTIQVTNISFNIYEETLPYLYPNTKYYITFNADVDRNNIIINLGGNHVVFDCKVGFNKVEITTPSDTTNLLTFSGTGVNINHVKVTQQDIDEYFEGMKSVGECEDLEITSANSDNTLSNTQRLTHEPLRAVGDVKDKYVLLDGKWHIERNCIELILDGSADENYSYHSAENNIFYRIDTVRCKGSLAVPNISDKIYDTRNYSIMTTTEMTMYHNSSALIIHLTNDLNNIDKFRTYLSKNPLRVILALETPIYEEINYNPFETYSDITHITANSLIPTNMVIKNHGYNCILKPSTKYTVALNKPNGTISAKLGGSEKIDSTNSIFTIITPSTLSDNVLRLSGSGNIKDIMILEGDKTINTPSYFEGIESAFEQEYDTEKGKYRVTARVEGNGKESSIIFYINEPLRGTNTAKDRVFIQDGKVIVERNCAITTIDGSEDVGYIFGGINKTVEYRISKRLDTILVDNATVPNILSNKLPTNNLTIWANVDIPCISLDSQGDVVLRTYVADTGVNKDSIKQYLQTNPITIVYQLAEPIYEEADCDLSKLVLENYENSSLIFESNIPVSANIRYSGEVPVVTQAKALSSKVNNTTFDINENIIPYMCDIDYRIVELQLMNGDTQGEGIELLGIGDIEILGNENVLFNNREDKKYNYSYDMLKRDILSQRYSKEEYRYRLDRYLLANKISNEEYKELEGLLNNGE